MISNCVPKNKQLSNTNRDRDRNRDTTAPNVSSYQHQEPVEGRPVPGTNGTVENMVDCWKYGRKGHIFSLCSEVTRFQGIQFMCYLAGINYFILFLF